MSKLGTLTDAAPVDPRDAAAARAWLEAKRQPAIGADEHLALWLRSTPDGKALLQALRAYDLAKRDHGERMRVA